METQIAQIASAYFANNKADKGEIKDILIEIRKGLAADPFDDEDETNGTHKSKEEIKASLRDPMFIVSFLDGQKYKTMKKHLSLKGFTPEEYRAHFGLPADYPMTARGYAAERSALAKKMGLGRKAA